MIFGKINYGMPVAGNNFRCYEIDFDKNIFKADGPNDHRQMMEALREIKEIRSLQSSKIKSMDEPQKQKESSIILKEAVDKFFIFKPALTVCSIRAYSSAFKDFIDQNPDASLDQISGKTINKYVENLMGQGLSAKTIDKKISMIRSLFSEMIKRSYFEGQNPAKEKFILTRAQKNESGSTAFLDSDIRFLFGSKEFLMSLRQKPRFFHLMWLSLVTGARVGALTRLKYEDFKIHDEIFYVTIKKDKTPSGCRDVPIPFGIWTMVREYLKKNVTMGYETKSEDRSSSKASLDLNKFYKSIGFKCDGKTFHGFRKFLNQHLMEDDVSLEKRCQFLGHAIDHVNTSVYGKKFSISSIHSAVANTQKKIIELTGLRELNLELD